MASYFSPDLFGSLSPGINNGRNSNSSFEAPEIEQLRGAVGSPIHRQVRSPPRYDQEEEEQELQLEELGEPSPSEFIRRLKQPIEERRKIPGSGINEFDSFRESVRAETSPVNMEELFGPEIKTYGSRPPRRRPQRLAATIKSGVTTVCARLHQPIQLSAEAIVQSTESQIRELQEKRRDARAHRPVRHLHYPSFSGSLSPLSSSSSSSSSSSGSPILNYDVFHPALQSSVMRTPPHQRYRDTHRVGEHPAFIPTLTAEPPENYYPSPSSSVSYRSE